MMVMMVGSFVGVGEVGVGGCCSGRSEFRDRASHVEQDLLE